MTAPFWDAASAVDRSGWRRGPWDGEPDHETWEISPGVIASVTREKHGYLCWSLALDPGHPWQWHSLPTDDRMRGCRDPVHEGMAYDSWGYVWHGARTGDLSPDTATTADDLARYVTFERAKRMLEVAAMAINAPPTRADTDESLRRAEWRACAYYSDIRNQDMANARLAALRTIAERAP